MSKKNTEKKFLSLKRFLALLLCLMILFKNSVITGVSAEEVPDSNTEDVTITATAAVLIEGSTGKILYSKNATKELRPASITKIMTLLLIFEALDTGQIKLTDMVPVSEHAASMGGSQVFLEPYETQDVNTMIKCISIASANDASVAMAEFVAGSEESFVKKMNERAKELGMNNTNFVNCYGLDNDGHYSSALDVALMSRELITKHPQISNYTTVWMDTFIHTTKKGETEFGLTNTNKLIKSYQGITGLKTGSTSLAKYCLSATARRDNMDLIAVIMAAPDTKTRFAEASTLLNYGFANCSLYTDNGLEMVFPEVAIQGGVDNMVSLKPNNTFSYVCTKDVIPAQITRRIEAAEKVKAPISSNTQLGRIVYEFNGTEIGSLPLYAEKEVKKAGYIDYLQRLCEEYFY